MFLRFFSTRPKRPRFQVFRFWLPNFGGQKSWEFQKVVCYLTWNMAAWCRESMGSETYINIHVISRWWFQLRYFLKFRPGSLEKWLESIFFSSIFFSSGLVQPPTTVEFPLYQNLVSPLNIGKGSQFFVKISKIPSLLAVPEKKPWDMSPF